MDHYGIGVTNAMEHYGMTWKPCDLRGAIIETELKAGDVAKHDLFLQHRLLSFLEDNRGKLYVPPRVSLQLMHAEGIVSVEQLWNCLRAYPACFFMEGGSYEEIKAQEKANELLNKFRIKTFDAMVLVTLTLPLRPGWRLLRAKSLSRRTKASFMLGLNRGVA